MKPLVIYHANCADGFGAAFAAWTVLGDDAEYLPMAYGDVLDTAVVGRTVYILDFSLPREEFRALLGHAGKIVWLDHHKTAFEMWCGTYKRGMRYAADVINASNLNDDAHTIELNDNKSGALLAWEHFHPGEEVPRLIQHIDDYDRWQFKIDHTKAFNKALWSYAPWSFEQWQEFAERADTYDGDEFSGRPYYDRLVAEGGAILRAHNQNVQSAVKHARKVAAAHALYGKYPEWHGLAVNCPAHMASDVGHELATQAGTFGLCWTVDEHNVVRCSLRSNGDYDVSAIAKAFGGGGHKNASGFSTDLATLQAWLED